MTRWDLANASRANTAKIEALLRDGWEPFAVSAHLGEDWIYFRRHVEVPDGPDPQQ